MQTSWLSSQPAQDIIEGFAVAFTDFLSSSGFLPIFMHISFALYIINQTSRSNFIAGRLLMRAVDSKTLNT